MHASLSRRRRPVARALPVRLALALFAAWPLAGAAEPHWMPEGARTPAAYVVEADGRVLLGRGESVKRQPASLAKLAAALVVAEAAHADPALLQASTRVSARAARAGGTRLGLRAGERLSVSSLLAAMLVGSANDACVALAERVADSAQAFVTRMNRLAARIGMADTRFVDPCGFDRPGQHTTALDLLALARRALAEPLLADRTALPSVHVATTDGRREFVVHNTNALLGRYDGAFGLKTGFTRGAGPCLIAAAQRGSSIVVAVVLGGEDRWPVAVALLDEAFERLTGYPRVRSRSTIGEPDS